MGAISWDWSRGRFGVGPWKGLYGFPCFPCRAWSPKTCKMAPFLPFDQQEGGIFLP